MSHHGKPDHQWKNELKRLAMNKHFRFSKPPNQKQHPQFYPEYKKILDCPVYQRLKSGQAVSVSKLFGKSGSECTCSYQHEIPSSSSLSAPHSQSTKSIPASTVKQHPFFKKKKHKKKSQSKISSPKKKISKSKQNHLQREKVKGSPAFTKLHSEPN